MTSYIKLLNKIEGFCDAHYQIQRFGGEFREQMPNISGEGIQYPIVFVSPTAGNPYYDTNQISVDIYCVDIIQKGRENLNTIVSDCHLILTDLYGYFHQGSDLTVDIVGTPSQSPLNNLDMDYVAGWVMTCVFELDGYCVDAIPMGEIVPFVPSCADATVENSDGTYTDTVASGDTLVLPDSQLNVNGIDEGDVVSVKTINVDLSDGVSPVVPTSVTITGNTVDIVVSSGVCADATVENSDVSYTDTVASGGTLVLPDVNANVNGTLWGTMPSVQDVDVNLLEDGLVVNVVNASVVNNTIEIEIDDQWVRPTDWLEIDSLVDSLDQRWVGLMAVFNETIAGNPQNYVTLISSQAYTVDVDGVTTNYGAGVRAEIQVTWASVAGTTTSEGFRQSIIQAYAQVGNWTGDFYCSYTRATAPTRAIAQWIDIRSSLPNVSNYYQNAFNNVMSSYLKKSVHLHPLAINVNARYQGTGVVSLTDDFSLNTSLVNCFNLCSGRINIPSFSTNATTIATFASNSNIKSVGNITANSATAVTGAFQATSIKTMGTITVNAVTASTTNFVISNPYLSGTLAVSATSATTLNSSFYDNPMLEVLNITSSASLLNIGAMCTRNYKMNTLSISNCAGITTTTTALSNCVSLKSLTLTGLTRGITVPPCNMNEQAFIDFFNSLGTASGAQTIVITGNITLLASTLLIATGKGFTVTP